MQNQHIRHSKYGTPFHAGKRKKRIVIGGDPHSGKSTFMVLLKRDLKEKGIDVDLIDLDYSSPTTEWLEGKESVRSGKRPWTPGLAQQAREDFRRVSRKNDLTLGDTPGRVTNVTRTIVKGAHGAIILARDETAKHRWIRFFSHKRIPVITIINTKLTKGLNWFSPKTDRGNITNLDRDDLRAGRINSDNVVIEGVSFEIAQFFGYTFRTR